MSRKPRVEYEGAVYHVMNRGDRGGRIFRDDLDYELFIKTMGEVCRRTGWKVHSYVLLPNHFHWQIETPEANLVNGMKWFLGVYSQRFNNRHSLHGHVFQGRYKAVLIEADAGGYFETVSTYVHLNPARAKLLGRDGNRLEEYRWSSCPYYLEPARKRPAWLEVRRVLGNIGLEDDAQGRRAYRDYLAERVRELRTKRGRKSFREEWKAVRFGWYAGSEEFGQSLLERLSETVEGKQRSSYSGAAISEHDLYRAESLVKKGMDILEIDDDDLARLPKGHELKCLLAWLAQKHTTASLAWLAERLHMGAPTAVSAYIKRIDQTSRQPAKRLKKQLLNSVL